MQLSRILRKQHQRVCTCEFVNIRRSRLEITLVLLSVTTASAAADGRFHIPFQFLMGDKVLPAGDYNVKIYAANKRIELTSWQGSAAVCLSANTPLRAVSEAETGKLVFHKFGKMTVLQEMWRSGANYGHELARISVLNTY
jgi:hypothetical protein